MIVAFPSHDLCTWQSSCLPMLTLLIVQKLIFLSNELWVFLLPAIADTCVDMPVLEQRIPIMKAFYETFQPLFKRLSHFLSLCRWLLFLCITPVLLPVPSQCLSQVGCTACARHCAWCFYLHTPQPLFHLHKFFCWLHLLLTPYLDSSVSSVLIFVHSLGPHFQ